MQYETLTQYEDTIAAIITGVGGAVTIIRVSGSYAIPVVNQIWRGRKSLDQFSPRQIYLGSCHALDGQVIDAEVLAFIMPAPHSYTGENIVELQCHGGSLIGQMLLNALLQTQKCRSAEPGEFTKRAFLNVRIDLTQAEAVADIISARSQGAVHLASKQLQGYLGKEIHRFYDKLVAILAEIESRLDFPDENLDWMDNDHISLIFSQAQQMITRLLQSRQDGEIYKNGLKLVIAGVPNVGKSSLMNAILGRDRAIVTHVAGTTRDVIAEMVQLRGIPICLTDTAGLRQTDDIVEQSGIKRSHEAMKNASLILWLYDLTDPSEDQFPTSEDLKQSLILVGNKADLASPPYSIPEDYRHLPHAEISAKNGTGFSELIDIIEKKVWQDRSNAEPEYAVNTRHAALLNSAAEALKDAQECISRQDIELGAVTLRSALTDIGKITGQTAEHDILDDIFSKFCIGK